MSAANSGTMRDDEAFNERAAIMQYDGGLAPHEAEVAAHAVLRGTDHAKAATSRSSACIEVKSIRTDGRTQTRVAISEATVVEYAEALAGGAELPPVVVFFDGKDYWLADGFHRVAAYEKCHRQTVPADVRLGSQRDAILHAVGANSMHGLRRTNEDKRKAVAIVLNDAEWSKRSLREIARLCGVSYQLVSNIMQEHDAPPPAPTEPHPEAGAVNIDKLKPPKTSGDPAELPLKVEGTSTSPPPGLTAQEKADVIAADAHGDVTVSQLLDETQAELEAAIKKIAALEADDKVKELSKWQTAADVYARRADEHLAKVNLRDKELTRLNGWLKKISEIVGEEDYSKLPATVKVFVDTAAEVVA